jgi:integrase
MPMAKDLLTPTKLEKMDKTAAVGRGLYVIVRGKSKSYGFRGTLNGKQLPMLYLGSVKKTSIAEARAETERCNKLIRRGVAPRADKAKRKVHQRGGAPATVNDMLDRYFARRVEPRREHDTDDKRDGRIGKARRYLGQISKAIGKVPVTEVVTEMLTAAIAGFEELSSSGNELRMHVRKAFDYAVALGWRKGCDPANPASKHIIDELLPNEYRKREPRASLSYIGAPRFVAAVKARKNNGLGKKGRDLVTTAPLLFLVYTGVRTNEVRQARWGEINWGDMLWEVPSDHRKLGHAKDKIRAVPISRPMLKVLEGQKKTYGGKPEADDLIFPGGARNGGIGRGVINSFIKNTLKWDVKITVHGFRATLNAWAKAQRPHPYRDIFIKAQFDHLGKKSEDDDRWLRPSMADKHYSHSDVDPTIEGVGARREMIERYNTYLDSCKLEEGLPQ